MPASTKPCWTLGIAAARPDSAAAILRDGEIVAAAQEERFTRRKHEAAYPRNAIDYCLSEAGMSAGGLDLVVAAGPESQEGLREHLGPAAAARLRVAARHRCQAASAFFPSPFDEATVITLDGGDGVATSVMVGRGRRLRALSEWGAGASLGALYSAFTGYCGFRPGAGDYKLMGLAPYGKPRFARAIEAHLVSRGDDGCLVIDERLLADPLRRLTDLLGRPPRRPESALSPHYMDTAASIQAVTEQLVLAQVGAAVAETGIRDVCMAGAVALNCVANGRLLRSGLVDRLWVQPASGNAGAALGAAALGAHEMAGRPRPRPTGDAMRGGFLGPSFSDGEIAARLHILGAVFERVGREALIDRVVTDLAAGKAVGWFQGRMEFGPRALGARSILADPRDPSMQAVLNRKVKYRESFRPFAPAVPAESASDWFGPGADSPYMLLVAAVAEDRRGAIPAVTHVDGSARVQTVRQEANPLFHRLLSRFGQRTGCPVLVNTSFNVRGEPIVCTPEDAYRCFMGSDIETLAIGGLLLRKDRQPRDLGLPERVFEPD